NVVVRLGSASVGRTNASGFYFLTGAPAKYTLRQEVPEGYAAEGPDSAVVDFIASPANFTHNFPDTTRPGGWIVDTCWVDQNVNYVRDPSEQLLDNVAITVNGTTRKTDGAGSAAFFEPPGSYSVSAAAPDSYTVITTNPRTVSITNGSRVEADFGV